MSKKQSKRRGVVAPKKRSPKAEKKPLPAPQLVDDARADLQGFLKGVLAVGLSSYVILNLKKTPMAVLQELMAVEDMAAKVVATFVQEKKKARVKNSKESVSPIDLRGGLCEVLSLIPSPPPNLPLGKPGKKKARSRI